MDRKVASHMLSPLCKFTTKSATLVTAISLIWWGIDSAFMYPLDVPIVTGAHSISLGFVIGIWATTIAMLIMDFRKYVTSSRSHSQ